MRLFVFCLSLLPLAVPIAGAGTQTEAARAHLLRGSEHLKRNQKQEAVRELKSAVALDPKSAQAHMLLGQAYLATGALELIAEAKGELQQALALDPKLVWARFYLAKIYFDLGRNERARTELERALADRPNLPHALALLGEAERKLGNPARAVELARRALAADPKMTPAHYYLALAHLDMKQEESARLELQRALQSQYVIPEIYIALGSLHVRDRDLAGAAGLFRQAIALDPARPEGHLRLAEVHRLERNYDRALEELRRARADEGRFLTSPYFQRVRAEIVFETGRVFEERGERREAIAAYRQALDVEPDYGDGHRQLATLLADEGDAAGASAHLRRAEELGAAIEPELRERILGRKR